MAKRGIVPGKWIKIVENVEMFCEKPEFWRDGNADFEKLTENTSAGVCWTALREADHIFIRLTKPEATPVIPDLGGKPFTLKDEKYPDVILRARITNAQHFLVGECTTLACAAPYEGKWLDIQFTVDYKMPQLNRFKMAVGPSVKDFDGPAPDIVAITQKLFKKD